MEEFLLEVDEKNKYKISVDRLYFGLRRMAEMVETTLPALKMDFAIFVVHANESRLSINEENAGIGYARLYKALLRATGEFELNGSLFISSKFLLLRSISLSFIHRIEIRLKLLTIWYFKECCG